MGLVIMMNYSIKLGGEAAHGAVFALRLGSGKDSASPLEVALPHWGALPHFSVPIEKLRCTFAQMLRCRSVDRPSTIVLKSL